MISLVPQALVGVCFLVSGIGALSNSPRLREPFAALGIGRVGRWFWGALSSLGGVALLAALAQPFLVFFVSVFLVLLSIAMVITCVVRKYSQGGAMIGLLLVGTLVAAALQPLGLKVLLLPKADKLPLDPVVSARVLKTYDEGLWFESVAIGPDGTVYLAGNKGEDYATGDKSRAQAQVIARAPDGSERVYFKFPIGTTAGVIAFDPAGRMYMTSQGGDRGVWRLSGPGTGEFFAKLPVGAWPNGMTVGPDGQLYVADASLGAIWRVDPITGASSRAIESADLRARRFIALAPGANGVHFHGRDLFVTVSDATRVLKYRLGDDQRFSAPVEVAKGIPGDDFAIDTQGSLYITTHPYNTLVRVTPDGKRDIIAKETHGIIGATDAAFGVLPGDRDTLYVATDGGAFSGDAKSRGTLVALKLKR